jgi:hypothetical protein
MQVTTSHGYIPQATKLTLSLPVYVKASAAGQSPVVINKEQRMVERGKEEEQGSYISFWYHTRSGESHVEQEKIGKYVYSYCYEPEAPDERHVLINLSCYPFEAGLS